MFFLFLSVIIVFVYIRLVGCAISSDYGVSEQGGLMDKWVGNKYIVVRPHPA